jgi:hypothetical protein
MLDAVVRRATEGPGRLGSAVRVETARNGDVPAALRPLVETAHAGAWNVEDVHFEPAWRAGYNEDQLFEVVVCAALGAASKRLQAALRALGRR